MNPEIVTYCWTCGKDIPLCTCGAERVVMEVKRPSEILPVCGTINYKDMILEPWLDPDRKHEVLSRPCCQCGQYWGCTADEWINGTCPNCGASGNQVDKYLLKNSHKLGKNTESSKIKYQKLNKIEKEINLINENLMNYKEKN